MDISLSSSGVGALPGRSARSCTDCTRRKTKCDRNIPCSACVKRGGAASCSAPEKKKRGPEPSIELDARRSAALSEIECFRGALDSLRARLPGLEYFIANVSRAQQANDDDDDFDEDLIQHFGDTKAALPGGSPSAPASLGRHDSGTGGDAKGRRPTLGRGRGRESTGGGYEGSGREESGEPYRKRVKEDSPDRGSEGGNERDDEAVEASVNLEFLALGRPRTFAESHDRPEQHHSAQAARPTLSPLAAIMHSATFVPSPVLAYPDGASLLAVAPNVLEERIILDQGLDTFGWHHSVVHSPTFKAQLSASWSLGDRRFDACSPSWLALYFALLAVSTKLMSDADRTPISWTEGTTSARATQWFDCAIACLYRANFLQNHDLHALQAIALLALSGRDAGSATLIASLLATGISIAQDMGLHRLPSDKAWAASLVDRSQAGVSTSLIEREVRKRVMYALAHTDWFSLPFRNSVPLLHRSQITTPLPLNATDADLESGEIVDRPLSEYTPASWLLQYIALGSMMEEAYTTITSAGDKADYDAFRAVDSKMDHYLNNLPPWLQHDGSTEGMPHCVDLLRTTFQISAAHKVLSMHRPFLFKPYSPSAHAFSRRRVIGAARSILRAARTSAPIKIWTFAYHTSAAAFAVTLELFEALKKPGMAAEAEVMREEVRLALAPLYELRSGSGIAERGLALVEPLLVEEARLRDEYRQRQAAQTGVDGVRGRQGSSSVTSPGATSGPGYPTPPPLGRMGSHQADLAAGFGYGASSNAVAESPGYYAGLAVPDGLPSWFQVGMEDEWLNAQLGGLQGGGTGGHGEGVDGSGAATVAELTRAARGVEQGTARGQGQGQDQGQQLGGTGATEVGGALPMEHTNPGFGFAYGALMSSLISQEEVGGWQTQGGGQGGGGYSM